MLKLESYVDPGAGTPWMMSFTLSQTVTSRGARATALGT